MWAFYVGGGRSFCQRRRVPADLTSLPTTPIRRHQRNTRNLIPHSGTLDGFDAAITTLPTYIYIDLMSRTIREPMRRDRNVTAQ